MSQNLEAGIFALITGAPSVSALIATRLFPTTLPEGVTLPAVRYLTAGGSNQPTFQTSGMQRWRFQFDCIGATPDDAFAVRTALIALLNGWSGTLTDGTRATFLLIQPLDGFDSAPRQYRCGVEFYCNFTFN